MSPEKNNHFLSDSPNDKHDKIFKSDMQMMFLEQKFYQNLMSNYIQRLQLNLQINKIHRCNKFLQKFQFFHTQSILRNESKEYHETEDDFKETIKYYKFRSKALANFENTGSNIYNNKFSNYYSLASIIGKYSCLKPEEKTSAIVTVAGRVKSIRPHGKKLIFYDITENGTKLQVKFHQNYYESKEEYKKLQKFVSIGDYIGVKGPVMKTRAGELSVLSSNFKVLAPCLQLLPNPTTFMGASKLKIGYVDLIMNEETKFRLSKRMNIINFIKTFLKERGYLEVKTPHLTDIPSGAVAKPFKSKSENLKRQLYFRISPELCLKMLIIGSFDKVFEIGQQFRNESMDDTHFPSFTTCEFYVTIADYNDLLSMTESMISSLIYEMFGSYKIQYDNRHNSDPYCINFEPPFQRVDLMSGLESKLGRKLPDANSMDSSISRDLFAKLCQEHEIIIPFGSSVNKMIDKLCDKLLVSNFINPTFLINYPSVMSPLAKPHRDRPGLTERFELFVAKFEICNAYTELNDPKEQEHQFKKFAKADGIVTDGHFVHALRHGLPPTAGWGIGIDRLIMLLTNSHNINQVILFSYLKNAVASPETEIKLQNEKKAQKSPLEDKLKNLTKQLQLQKIYSESFVRNPMKMNEINLLNEDSQNYYIKREQEMESLVRKGFNMYPHKFECSHSLSEIVDNKPNLQLVKITSNCVSITGRISSVKKMEDNQYMCVIFNNEAELQLILCKEYFINKEEFSDLTKFINKGDHIGVKGHITKTDTGETAVQVTELQILTPCLVALDKSVSEDYVSLMLNKQIRQIFFLMANIKDCITHYLNNNGFLHIDTPVFINSQCTPPNSFITHFDDFNTNLHVCTTPEIHLLESLVGGFNKVYEIRTQFRNVVANRISYPEFTTCQFFMIHAHYQDIMEMTETMLSDVVFKLFHSYEVKYNPTKNSKIYYDINFRPPFQRTDFMSSLENKLGVKLPDPLDLHKSGKFFFDICNKNGINIDREAAVWKMMDKLCDKFVISDITSPTFIINHPAIMSQLSKSNRDNDGLTERFQLIIANMELGNGFSAINDPREQEARYKSTVVNDNGMIGNDEHIDALCYGLPSAAGLSMGIDRLTMVLGNIQHINEVILFPKLGKM